MPTRSSVQGVPAGIEPDTPLTAFDLPTRLRTVLSRRLPVHTAAELAALPIEHMHHISGLGVTTRPVLEDVVAATRRRLVNRLAPRLAGYRELPDTPLSALDGKLPRRERLLLDGVGVRTLVALGQMPRAVLGRMPGLGFEAVGRLSALCFDDTAMKTLGGLLLALDRPRREALVAVYGLRDGVERSPLEAALDLGMPATVIEGYLDRNALRPLPPMRVLLAAVREAIAPVGFAVLTVVAGRVARRLPLGDDDALDPVGFARLGAHLVRPEGALEVDGVRLVADPRWSPAAIAELARTLRALHADGSDEDEMGDRLVEAAARLGHPDLGPDALLVAVAALCPGVVLTLSPRELPPPPITDPEIHAIMTVRLEAAPPPDRAPAPPPHLAVAPDSTDAVRERVASVIELVGDHHATDHPLEPPAPLLDALADGGVRGLLVRRGPDTVERLAAGLAPHAPTRALSIGRALTAGLGAMTDAASLTPEARAARLGDALDAVLDLGGAAAPGAITLLADLSLPLVLGLGDWIGSVVERAADGGAGLVVLVAPGVADGDGMLVDRLHRLPGLDGDAVISLA